MNGYYEVMFRDGFGAWRRWAVKRTIPAAEASRQRLQDHLGQYYRPENVRVAYRPR